MIGLTVARLLIGRIAALGIALLDVLDIFLIGDNHCPIGLTGNTIMRSGTRCTKRHAGCLCIGHRGKLGFARR